MPKRRCLTRRFKRLGDAEESSESGSGLPTASKEDVLSSIPKRRDSASTLETAVFSSPRLPSSIISALETTLLPLFCAHTVITPTATTSNACSTLGNATNRHAARATSHASVIPAAQARRMSVAKLNSKSLYQLSPSCRTLYHIFTPYGRHHTRHHSRRYSQPSR